MYIEIYSSRWRPDANRFRFFRATRSLADYEFQRYGAIGLLTEFRNLGSIPGRVQSHGIADENRSAAKSALLRHPLQTTRAIFKFAPVTQINIMSAFGYFVASKPAFLFLLLLLPLSLSLTRFEIPKKSKR